ncbi:hypothetical protein ANN_23174 [Periplaneta americana]|uniref:Uncharacterized protein n=1 Tax=Periplaneta americana TaxID=6978 RepID=A0ABQ8SLL7_PERAM|nr:hypothetical protein ANN_23174 [Periplaneta americana]
MLTGSEMRAVLSSRYGWGCIQLPENCCMPGFAAVSKSTPNQHECSVRWVFFSITENRQQVARRTLAESASLSKTRVVTWFWEVSLMVCCGFLEDHLLGLFIFPGHLTDEMYLHFLQEQLSQLEDVPLARRRQMYFQHDGALLTSTTQ